MKDRVAMAGQGIRGPAAVFNECLCYLVDPGSVGSGNGIQCVAGCRVGPREFLCPRAAFVGNGLRGKQAISPAISGGFFGLFLDNFPELNHAHVKPIKRCT